jgi:hypothetical protein
VGRSLVAIIAIVGAILSPRLSAQAAFTPTPSLLFTAPFDGTLIFTYEGFSADDLDQMGFDFNGNPLFTNKTAAVGAIIQESVVAGQLYTLSLHNDQTGDTWSSDPALNWDGQDHLASTAAFSDFHLGAMAPTPVNAGCAIPGHCYLGWEDLPGAGADHDFNDLVFALQFTPITTRAADDPVPEPGTLKLLAIGMLGLGFVARRRSRARAWLAADWLSARRSAAPLTVPSS